MRRSAGGRKGPVDQFISTAPSYADFIAPGKSNYAFAQLWGWGQDVASMLTNIRAETPFTLVGGGSLYQPTLKVYGYATFDICVTGNADVVGEFVVFTPREHKNNTIAQAASAYALSWTNSWDAIPTGFETFPDTRILQNYSFWSGAAAGGYKATKRRTFKVRVGRPKRYTFRFATRTFKYEDYASTGFLTGAASAPNKSFGIVWKVAGERGQVCGLKNGAEFAFLNEVGATYMVRIRDYYFYRWVPGNNRPTVYGSNLSEEAKESIPAGQASFVGVPSQKAQRYSYGTVQVPGTAWGAVDFRTRQEVQANPIIDCDGITTFAPLIQTANPLPVQIVP